MDHLEPFRQRVRQAKIVPAPPPWRQTSVHAVGGLTEVGFADDGELLLVLSWAGRGIFDCASGQRIARDARNDRDGWYGHDDLIANGFGPLEGQRVRLMGLWGGGLPTCTKDLWRVAQVILDWPDVNLLLYEPGSKQYTAEDRFYKLDVPLGEVRAFGFSYTGKTLIIATSSDVTIFSRL